MSVEDFVHIHVKALARKVDAEIMACAGVLAKKRMERMHLMKDHDGKVLTARQIKEICGYSSNTYVEDTFIVKDHAKRVSRYPALYKIHMGNEL